MTVNRDLLNAICEHMDYTYLVATCDCDIEDGYSEFNDSFTKIDEIPAIVKRAESMGVPAYRLTVTETGSIDGEYFSDTIGNLDDFL